jgi:hypothetical protein
MMGDDEFFAAMGELGRATAAAREDFDTDTDFRAWRRDNVPISAAPLAPTREDVEAAEQLAPLMDGNGEIIQELRLRHPRVMSLRSLLKKRQEAEKRERRKAGIPNPEADAERKRALQQVSSKAVELGRVLQGRMR